MSVEERFVVKTGRFGAYFYDNRTNEEMDLAVVQWSLNLLWNDSKELQSRKISESSKQSTTQVKSSAGATAEQIAEVVGKLVHVVGATSEDNNLLHQCRDVLRQLLLT